MSHLVKMLRSHKAVDKKVMIILYNANSGGENFREFGKSGTIRQVLLVQIYIIKLRVDSTMNKYTKQIAGITTKSTSVDSVQSLLLPISVSLGLPSFLSHYAPLLGAFQLYLCHPGCYCKHVHHFSTAHDVKTNDSGFKFSVACKWCVLIIAICQSFPHQI